MALNDRYKAQDAAREKTQDEENDACTRLTQVEIVDAEGAQQDGQQACDAAALARRTCLEQTNIASRLTAHRIVRLCTIGHTHLGAAIGATNASHLILSSELLTTV